MGVQLQVLPLLNNCLFNFLYFLRRANTKKRHKQIHNRWYVKGEIKE